MDTNTPEHLSMLNNRIRKMAIKTIAIGFGIGLFLNLPGFVIQNTFTMGLAFVGISISFSLSIYAVMIAIKKQKAIKKSLNKSDEKTD